MEELISRQAALNLKQTFTDNAGYETEYVDIEDIKELPTISSVENKGEWIKDGVGLFKCSECGRRICTSISEDNPHDEFPFCHCGADMRGEK